MILPLTLSSWAQNVNFCQSVTVRMCFRGPVVPSSRISSDPRFSFHCQV